MNIIEMFEAVECHRWMINDIHRLDVVAGKKKTQATGIDEIKPSFIYPKPSPGIGVGIVNSKRSKR